MNDTKLQTLRQKVTAERSEALTAALELADRAGTDPQADAELEFALDRLSVLDQRLEKIPKVTVRDRPIYGPGSPESFWRDLAAVAGGFDANASRAQDRLDRHQAAATVHAETRADIAAIKVESAGLILPQREQRALTLTAGQGGEFSPPDYLLKAFADVARSASPVLHAIPNLPLPPGCDAVFVPQVASSGGVQVQATENTNPAETWQTTALLEYPIATFSGSVPMSQQLSERGPNLDTYLVQSFAESFGQAAEQQILIGSGTAGQVLGLTNVSGINTVTYTSASPTVAGIVGSVGEAFGEVSNTRLRPPTHVTMTGERYAWIASTPDGSGNVASVRPGTGTTPSNSDLGEYGPVAGLPALLSGEIPQDVSGNQDIAVVFRANDLIWLESEPVFNVVVDTAAGASQLTVFAVWHCYGAFISNRYPTGIGVATGTGWARNNLTWT